MGDSHPLPDGGAVEKFMKYYEEDGYVAYEKLCGHTKRILIWELEQLEIKHEIFDRGKEGPAASTAKAPAHARRTITRRQEARGRDYETKEEILADMHDLAGLRVALYYPNDFEKVEAIIRKRFAEVKPPQDWPDQQFGPFRYRNLDGDIDGCNDITRRKSRFPGYLARHFRVRLRESDVVEPAFRLKTVEIQLMSLLMLAWSKMHYELIYKPRPGLEQADEDDERLLDISNGIVIAGEQVLRQLQINLDRKKKAGRLPFKNEHDAWSYLKEKWTGGGNPDLPDRIKSWLREAEQSPDGKLKHLLYKALEMLDLNSREKLDLLVKHCLDAYGHFAHSPNHFTFFEMLVVSVVDQDSFLAAESAMLQLPPTDKRSLSTSEAARLARYKALILCNSLRWFGVESLQIVWERRGSFPGPYPSGQELLDILHPTSPIERVCPPWSMARVRDLCEYMLDWDDPAWRVRSALSRLTCFPAELGALGTDSAGEAEGQSLARELAMTPCPYGLIMLLNNCAQRKNTTLGDAFRELKSKSTHDSASLISARHISVGHRLSNKGVADAQLVYIPRVRATYGNMEDWTVGEIRVLMLNASWGFDTVRGYLDRPVVEAVNQRQED